MNSNTMKSQPYRWGAFDVVMLVLLSTPCVAQLLPGESLPTLQTVDVAPFVQVSSVGIFLYSYTISNPSSNTGQIEDIEIDISKDTSSVDVGIEGVTSDKSLPPASVEIFNKNFTSLVPVGFRSPHGWFSDFTDDLTASWSATDPTGDGKFRVHPGETIRGFTLQSRGIPGIKSITIEPLFEQAPTLSGDATASDVQRVKTIEEQIKFTTMTLGPIAPHSLSPSSLIDNLILLKHQSVSLDWLRGEEFIKDLDEKLYQATKALGESKPFEARHKLREFIQKLDEQRKEQLKRQHEASEEGREEHEEHSEGDKKFINDNAFYLLKPNAEFIISKLPAKPSDDDDRDNNAAPEDRH